MKGLSAGLIFVSLSTIFGLFLGLMSGGLGATTAWLGLTLGAIVAFAAYLGTWDPPGGDDLLDSVAVESPPAENSGPPEPLRRELLAPAHKRLFSSILFWIVAGVFAMFAVRSFCWLLYIDGDELKIQSPNNLGDLALHITYIKDFANGTPLWPANPIFPLGKIRYPAGIDLFNALLCLAQVDLIRGLVWTGLLACLATFYALYRWGRLFTVAGFLFNGGVAGFAYLNTLQFLDYQGDKTIAWKSLPLSMLVTQRGLLYAIPAGLLLLWNWRDKFFRSTPTRRPGSLPFWIELTLYASMPLFHFHTFLALTIVLLGLFVCGDPQMRGHIVTLLASAFLPATFFVWLITDNFHAGSVVGWHLGWVMLDPEFKRSSLLLFWWDNFGIFIPLAVALFVFCAHRAWKSKVRFGKKLSEDIAFLIPAGAIFILALLVRLAPWDWDNLKVMIWAYFLVLPLLWSQLIAHWSVPVRVAVCIGLFGSGFVSLFGGLAAGRPGFGFATRSEVDTIGEIVRGVPPTMRFACHPTYNHPLLLQGRNVVLGYGGHLWTQGFDYAPVNEILTNLMLGKGDWRGIARSLGVRYIFWGREEKQNYQASTRPWEDLLRPFAQGPWGAIYDLNQSRLPGETRIESLPGPVEP